MSQGHDSSALNSILQLIMVHMSYAFPSLFHCWRCYGRSCCAVLCCAVLCCVVLRCAVLSFKVILSEPRQHAGTCLVIREARAGQAIKLSAVKVHDMICSTAWESAPGRGNATLLNFDVLLSADSN